MMIIILAGLLGNNLCKSKNGGRNRPLYMERRGAMRALSLQCLQMDGQRWTGGTVPPRPPVESPTTHFSVVAFQAHTTRPSVPRYLT